MFLLTADAEDGGEGCCLRFWGIGRAGPVLVRIPHHQPVFFISRSAVLPAGFRAERRYLDLKGFDGSDVDGLYFQTASEYRDGRYRTSEAALRTWESDVRPEDRYLMERFINGSAHISGVPRREGHLTVFDEPRITPSEWRPRLKTLSLDIETGRDGTLYSVAMDIAGPEGRQVRAAVLDPKAPAGGRVEPLYRSAGNSMPPDAAPAAPQNAAVFTPADVTTDSDNALAASAGASAALHTSPAASTTDSDNALAAATGKPNPDPPGTVTYLPTEIDLLRHFIKTVDETDPDVIIGWHVIGFDLSFLDEKSRQVNLPLRIGRGRSPLKLTERPGRLPIAELEGRIIIDGPPTLRGAFHKFSDWRLDTVAHELLGRRKDIAEHGQEKVEEIERRFREDKGALVRYNLEDAVLVTEIFERTGVLEQLVTRSLITGLPPDQVHRSVAAFDRFFLPRLHRKGRVAPNQSDISASGPSPGAMVFSSGAGLFEDVAVLDFKSLYPTIIRTFHIDPYSLLEAENHPLETPVNIRFSRSEHILPAYLGELMQRRSRAKAEKDDPLAQAVKILMNSMYGVMGSPGCRFYRAELPAAITGIGRWVLETTAERLRKRGYQVLYGDTDSVFVKLKTEERQNPEQAGERLAQSIDEYFREIIQAEYGVTSRLELEFEKRYVRLFLPIMRSGGESAVKRYAGLLPDGSVEIKGMEFVRSDSTPLAREFQYGLFRRYFDGEDLKGWIREQVEKIRSGEMDDKLIYKRRLSRAAKDYKSPPPHVRAVLMLDPDGTKDLREVEYVITPQGPVPMELNPQEIDYSHYIDKQLRSVADDILALQGESFDAVLGGRQLDLF